MAKSLRSKRKNRLKAKRRDLVEPHYDEKLEKCRAVLDAIVAAPSPYTSHVEAMTSAKDGNDALSGNTEGVQLRPGGMQAEMDDADMGAGGSGAAAMEEDGGKDKRLGVRNRTIGKASAGVSSGGRKFTKGKGKWMGKKGKKLTFKKKSTGRPSQKGIKLKRKAQFPV